MNIDYLSDPLPDYLKAIDAAKTVSELQQAIEPFRMIAADAVEVAGAMKSADFPAWRKGLAMERRRTFAGPEFSERFGAIMLPAVMLEAGLVAAQYCVPWGCAYIRLREVGRIVERDGFARLVTPKAKKSAAAAGSPRP